MHLPPHISGNPNCCCFFSRPANSILRQLTEVPQPDQVYFLVSKILKYTNTQIHKYTNTQILLQSRATQLAEVPQHD